MRLLRERAGEKSALLLAAGERADLPVLERLQVHRGDGGFHRAGIFLRVAAPPAEPQIAAHLHEAAHGGREIPIDLLALRQIGEIARGAADDVAVKADAARSLSAASRRAP